MAEDYDFESLKRQNYVLGSEYILPVLKYGNPILRKKCSQVTDFSKLSGLINDMFDTMYEEEGIGLAANQVGVDMNLFIIDISHTDDDEFAMTFFNGEISSS